MQEPETSHLDAIFSSKQSFTRNTSSGPTVEHYNNNFHHVLVILTSFYVFSHVIICVTLGNSEKIPEKCRVGVLSRGICPKLGQNQGNSLIFTKIAISQKHIFRFNSWQKSARNMKFGPVIENNDTKNCQESLFQNFHFLAFFDPLMTKKCDFCRVGGSKNAKK